MQVGFAVTLSVLLVFVMTHSVEAKGKSRSGWYNNQSPNSHQFNLVSNPHPVRYGRKSERFELRATDCAGTDCGKSRNRSEIGIEGPRVKARLNQDIWYGWSFYNANVKNYRFGQAPYFFLGQWKTESEACPTIALVSYGQGEYGQRNNIGLTLMDKKCTLGEAWAKANRHGAVCFLWNLEQKTGEWIDIVINTNFGTDDGGYVNVWINGKKKCEYRGRIVYTALGKRPNGNRILGPSHRHGIYAADYARWNRNFPNTPKPDFIVYYDEWRVGNSRDKVDIGLIESSGRRAVD